LERTVYGKAKIKRTDSAAYKFCFAKNEFVSKRNFKYRRFNIKKRNYRYFRCSQMWKIFPDENFYSGIIHEKHRPKREYLISMSTDVVYDRDKRVHIKIYLTVYIESGGFPESGINSDNSILQYYFQDILLRDIISRYQIKNIKEIKELALYLSTNY
jgi:hypothetical protein